METSLISKKIQETKNQDSRNQKISDDYNKKK